MVGASTPSITLPLFIRRTLGLRSRYRIPYDAVVKLRAGEPTYMLTHPDDVRHVLVDNAANYSKTPFLTSAEGKQRAGSGLLTATGDDHQRQRRLLQPLFHRAAVTRYAAAIASRLEDLFADWRHRVDVDIAEEMAQLTQSVIIGVLFGDDYPDEDRRLAHAIHARRLFTDHLYHSRLPFHTRLPLPVVRNHRAAMEVLDDTIAKEIRARRSAPDQRDDLLSLLIGLTYPDGTRMSDQQIRDEVLTFTSTGYETVGEALGWTFYLLLSHPDIAAELRAEVDRVLGDQAAQADDVARLALTECALKESMRLYPPTWVFVRVPLERDVLPSGAAVPAGAKLYLCQYVMHRHPRYFPSPEQFVPARFASGGRTSLRGVYFPFGDGPHICIGEAFANLQGVLVLAAVTQRFRLELLHGQKIAPRAGITLSPLRGIRVAVHPRADARAGRALQPPATPIGV